MFHDEWIAIMVKNLEETDIIDLWKMILTLEYLLLFQEINWMKLIK